MDGPAPPSAPPRRLPFLTPQNRPQGLSLLEIIVGLALLVLALLGVYGLVRGSMQSFGFSEDFLEVQQNARVALNQIAEEAKWAKSVEVGTADCRNPGLDPQCLSLLIPRDDPNRDPEDPPVQQYRVAFRWNGENRQLERIVPGAKPTALADYVTGMTFRYMDAEGETSDPASVVRVVADLTLKRRTTALAREVNVGSDIFLRNAAVTLAPPGSPTPGSPTPTATSTRPPYPPPGGSGTPVRTRTPKPRPTPTVRPR